MPKLGLFILLAFIQTVGECHPLHISVTEIAFDSQDAELEITIRIFANDLEESIRKEAQIDYLDLTDNSDSSRSVLSSYITQHFQVSVDARSKAIRFLGHELDGDAIVCYVQVPNVKKLKSLAITNTLIMNKYEDQSNFVHVTVNNEVQTKRLTYENQTGQFSF